MPNSEDFYVASRGNQRDFLVAGGLAGGLARTAVAPLERVKILYQASIGAGHSGARPQVVPFASRILRDEGVLGFWNGNTAAVMRAVPYMSLTFASYERLQTAFAAVGWSKPTTALAAGSLAGVIAAAVTHPLDVVRARMARHGCAHAHPLACISQIVRSHGVGALYVGLGASLLGIAPYTGLKLGVYEAIKGGLRGVFGLRDAQLHPWQRLAAGLLAGLAAQTAVYPFDVVRRRMQMHDGRERLYAGSTWRGLHTMARDEGLRFGLFRGLQLNYARTLPHVAIFFTLYEATREMLG